MSKRRKRNGDGFFDNVPKELIRIYKDNDCKIRTLEKLLGVNRYYIYRLLVNGIEPTKRTKKGMMVREKLFLFDKPKVHKPDFIVQWDHLPTDERHKVIKQYLEWRNKK